MTRKAIRTLKLSTLSLMGGVILLMAFQCGDDETVIDNTAYNVHHSKCLSLTKDAMDNEESATVSYSDGIAHITHYYLAISCGNANADNGVVVRIHRDGATIHIYETDNPDLPQTDCLCMVTNEFDIHNLESGTYTFVFHSWGGSEPYSLTITL